MKMRLIFCIFIGIASLIIIFLSFSPISTQKKTFFQFPSPSIPQSPQTKKQQQTTINILSLPGWPQDLSPLPDGSVRIHNRLGSTELTIVNSPRSTDPAPIKIGPNGFEAIVKMSTVVEGNPTHPAYGYVQFYNRKRLQVGFDNKEVLLVDFIDLNLQDKSKRFTSLITQRQNFKLSSGELKLVFSKKGSSEKLSFYDNLTGKALIENIDLPEPFFQDNNELRVGIYVVSGDTSAQATMLISKFEIVPK
jgi:hypothetical protein